MGSAAARVAAILEIPNELQYAGHRRLADLVIFEVGEGALFTSERLPAVREIQATWLGSTEPPDRAVGNPYVLRTKDADILESVRRSPFVLLRGPSKSGKTLSGFRALREAWPNAAILRPGRKPGVLKEALAHPAAVHAEQLVIWLEQLEDYLPIEGDLDTAVLDAVRSRNESRPTMIVATMTATAYDQLAHNEPGRMAAEKQLVLDRASEIQLRSMLDDDDEFARARAAYPELDFSSGPTETLACGPQLAGEYERAFDTNPALWAFVRAAVNWKRIGMTRPIPAEVLQQSARALLDARHLDDEYDPAILATATSRKSASGTRRPPMLIPIQGSEGDDDDERGYEAFSFLVAADSGQRVGGKQTDPVPIPLVSWLAARKWLTAVAESGNLGAQIGLSVFLVVSADQFGETALDEALAWLTKAAESGNPEAETYLGTFIHERFGATRLEDARTWWTKAAEQGDFQAQFQLGVFYASLIEPADYEKARAWYTKSARAGFTRAQTALGYLLLNEFGPADAAEGRYWYTEAAKAGDDDAQFDLGLMLATQLNPPEIDEAVQWWTKAAAQQNPLAEFSLGLLYATRFQPPNLKQARFWYTQAAEAGYAPAFFNLGRLLAFDIPEPELDQARYWWSMGAAAGDQPSSDALASLDRWEHAEQNGE